MIDFDKAASERYTKLYSHFEADIRDMEDFFWNQYYSEKIRTWFRDNIDELSEA